MEWNLQFAESVLECLDVISITDEHGKYIYANPGWLESKNLTVEQARCLHPWDIIPKSKVSEVLKTHKPSIGTVFEHNGTSVLSSIFPLFFDDDFIGTVIYSQYAKSEHTKQLAQLLAQLQKELDNSKKALNSLVSLSSAQYSLGQIVGNSPSMQHLRRDIINASKTPSNVLIEGETGTGKELVAHAIHALSNRSDNTLLRLNCSAIPESLVESELFGYEDGSFTGSKKGGKKGKFELANHGTMFLDEINALPLSIQPKLLRVLQEYEVERIGGNKLISLDVRYIAATNQSLRYLVEEEKFRADLFYRLNVVRINIPPLREHKEDIPLLCRHLIVKLNDRLDKSINSIDPKVIQMFQTYSWPGNIRELQNVLESAMNRTHEDFLDLSHFENFQIDLMECNPATRLTKKSSPQESSESRLVKEQQLHSEKAILEDVLKQVNGNRSNAAKLMGISRTALYKKLNKFNIK